MNWRPGIGWATSWRAGHHGGRTRPLAKHGLLPHDVAAYTDAEQGLLAVLQASGDLDAGGTGRIGRFQQVDPHVPGSLADQDGARPVPDPRHQRDQFCAGALIQPCHHRAVRPPSPMTAATTVSSDIMPPENPPRFNYAEPVSITTAGELETIFRAYRGNTGYLQKQKNNHSRTNEEARSANWARLASHGGGSGMPRARPGH